MKKISCIISAYNEEKGIVNVLPVAVSLLGKYIHEIIVIDDGSKDSTGKIVKGFPQVKLIEHETNMGKSKSVADGIRASSGDYIFLLDADLKFLEQKNIIDLINPINNNISQVTISYIKNSWPLFPFRKIDYLSGERIMGRSNLIENIDQMDLLPSYGLEVFINKIIIKNKLSIDVIKWANVENVLSQNKLGWLKGIKNVIKIWWNVLCTISIFEMYYQNIKMSRLMVQEKRSSVAEKNFKVSLIIPAYNEEKYIESCLEHAIKNSNGKFFEIIVVNNASTDKTSEKVRKFPEVRMVYESNKGLTRARQRGFLEAKGDILAYIDADTQMPLGWCEKVIETFNTDKNIVCLSGPGYYYDISRFSRWFSKNIYWRILAMTTYFIVGYMVFGANFAIRKDIINKMGGFDTSIEFYGEDTNIARRAYAFGKVKFKMDFFMYTSGRRLNNQGVLKTGFIYIINYLWVIFKNKPKTSNYKDFR